MSKDLLASFVRYCKKHPKERFWQALRNWSKSDKLIRHWYNKKGIADSEDTFFKD